MQTIRLSHPDELVPDRGYRVRRPPRFGGETTVIGRDLLDFVVNRDYMLLSPACAVPLLDTFNDDAAVTWVALNDASLCLNDKSGRWMLLNLDGSVVRDCSVWALSEREGPSIRVHTLWLAREQKRLQAAEVKP